ncbi:hypothetical protein NN3_16270 [Nocardia neocaledoniensis NBRC 108232]|nr:hypothetical protein NN3_16270 [Nocardia neocaledoniensis NBRC 108232]
MVIATVGRVALVWIGLHCVRAPLTRQRRLRRHYVMAIATLDPRASAHEGQALRGMRVASPLHAQANPDQGHP